MGIYEREYSRGGAVGARGFITGTVVGRLILVNLIIFVLQVLFTPQRPGPSSGLTGFLACSAGDLFGGFPQVWKLVTACFAHSTSSLEHIVFNMLLLFFFGRELEQIYGKRDFLILYLVAGALAIFCEAAIIQLTLEAGDRRQDVAILGASGSIMALVVLFATFFPHRTVLLFFVIPMPVWVLCVLVVLLDIIGLQSASSGIAHWAHLSGAAFGFCYRYFDLRWDSVMQRLAVRRQRQRVFRPRRREAPSTQERDDRPTQVSKRIDEILEKIHRYGMVSLTEEERRFLLENSKKYRSP